MAAIAACATALTGAIWSVAGAARLEIRPVDVQHLLEPGDEFTVSLWMRDLGEAEAAGFQAFLHFDSAQVSFVCGEYTCSPFCLWVIWPIAADGEHLDLAAGINVFDGQEPTSSDALLALLTFEAEIELCVPNLTFRDHDPPTGLTDGVGDPIVPLELSGIAWTDCIGDCEPMGGDGEVNIDDLVALINNWGDCAPGLCPWDVNCDGEVGIDDLVALINHWGPCP